MNRRWTVAGISPFVRWFGNRQPDLMKKTLERHIERSRGSVERRLEQRPGRKGRRARLHPDLGGALLRLRYAITTLSKSEGPRRSVQIRSGKKQNNLFIDAELGNARNIEPVAVGGSAWQREDDLVSRIALDRRHYPEPVLCYNLSTAIIHITSARHTLNMGDRLRFFTQRIEREPYHGCCLRLRHPDGQNNNGQSRSHQT